MSITTSLTIRSLIRSTLERSGLTGPLRSIGGLTVSARALAVAGVSHGAFGEVVLYVVPADADLEDAVADVRFFLASLEGLAAAVVDQAVLPLPSLQVDPYRGLAPHFQVTSARARALHALATRSAHIVVASAQALLPLVPPPSELLAGATVLRTGHDVEPQLLAQMLAEGGYERQDPVDEHGEFCLRGGILDVFGAGEVMPVRVEFAGDTIESIRRFDPSTQRSVETLDQFSIVPVREVEVTRPDPITAYLRGAKVVVAEPDEVHAQLEKFWTQVTASFQERRDNPKAADGRETRPPEELLLAPSALEPLLMQGISIEQLVVDDAVDDEPAESAEFTEDDSADTPPARVQKAPRAAGNYLGALHVPCQPIQEFHGRISDWIADIRAAHGRGDTVWFVAATRGRADRTLELLKDYEIRASQAGHGDEHGAGAVLVTEGVLSQGFRLPTAALQIYAETDVFEEERRRGSGGRTKSVAATFLSDLRDLKVGDLIVHVDHGIGQFVGLKQISVGDDVREFLELRYHGEDKLFVPVERLDLIQKYSGGNRPALDRLGGTTWERVKTKVKKAMRDMAEELLKLYAARRAVPGHAFSGDTHWQEEFEGGFPYELTPDQTTSVADIKKDMESATPMDRLLCGDVGYGKTEVAMRAAFKAVMDGKQVAFLAPTTVLASQHLKTLTERFAAFPARIDMVSRFRSKYEIKESLDALAAGRLDIIVGTHRLLSKDVQFRDLGLLIVDEEQRFGVTHKERIKQMRKKVDVLTLTATPIPRTLNMSLVGIRDMSVIETPPRDRLSIQTNVVKFDAAVITRAIRTEIARGGQVYFVHNRVESIFSMANLITRLVPEARVVIGHGQMGEHLLERAMLGFMTHQFDVLLSTTIVENGLDIPNANTIIINRADRYGLSQLYQLRGRVGRSDRAAYAYLLIPPEQSLSPVARKRLAAIKEFSDLGSGFRVAALDLEIRGAGNLLGGQQSGQMDTVGFEMYMKLLEDTIRELKGEDLEDDVRASVNLKVDFRLSEAYIPDMNQRLMVYRRIAAARSEEEIASVVSEVRDRYGPAPIPLLNLADYSRIRVLSDSLGVESVDREGSVVVFKFRDKTKVDLTRIVKLVRERDDLQLIPPSSLKLTVRDGAKLAATTEVKVGVGLVRRPRRQPAWWTARATTGEVTAGFSKAEILKDAPEDPRAPDGVLDRVTGLLLALSDEQ